MSKRKATRQKEPIRVSRRRRRKLALVSVLLSLGLVSSMLANWSSVRRTIRTIIPAAMLVQTQPTPPPPSSPTKEYIYAGGKLIATEEPSVTTLTAPSGLKTTTISNSQIALTWSASTGGTVDHYQVERTATLSTPFAALTPNATTTTYTDSTVSQQIAYLYRVCAIDSAGNHSPYSNTFLAVAFSFSDEPLQARATTVKAQHITELQTAISAVRVTAGLSGVTWTVPTAKVTVIAATDVQSLRTNLDAALSALGLAVNGYSNTLVAKQTQIHAIDIEELRQRVGEPGTFSE